MGEFACIKGSSSNFYPLLLSLALFLHPAPPLPPHPQTHTHTQVGTVSAEHPELCERCLPVVEALGFKLPGTTTAAANKASSAAAAEKATAAA